jgi:tRNA nucleotidyltransferase (CCA-adding enzyme)
MASWSDGVLERLDSPVLSAVRHLTGVWVVGGAVRDVLLGRVPRELDLLVEGEAEPVARALGTPSAIHERFGTFTVDGTDVTAARRETYARPGALPDVQLGATVAEDLERRDFTVNAMAVRVSDGAGEAVPGALEDLEARQLRVLHPRSFVDDPTRALRMARYAARLGFTVEGETARLAADPDFSTVSGSRIGAEVRLALAEPLPAALVELARFGVPLPLRVDTALLAAVGGWMVDDADGGLAALGACLLDAEGVADALDALAFPAAERAIVVAAARGRELAEALDAAAAPSEVAAAAAGQPIEALAVAAALGADEPVARWLGEWRHVRLAISGDDLVAAGLHGPAVGAGLRAALAAALDGLAPDRETQLAVALA